MESLHRQQELDGRLQLLQQLYISVSRGVFSTTAANVRLLQLHRPTSMIIDEASQLVEARCVGAVLEAVQQGSLERVLLIGDNQQLPPTVMSDTNPFKLTNAVSLFERLIFAGFPVITLQTQFRTHHTISSICKSQIYTPIGINLSDGLNTQIQNGNVAKFQKWVANLAYKAKCQITPTNAIIVSPVKSKDAPWESQKKAGSKSRYNLANAKIILHLLAELDGHFANHEIIIVSFYKDQVQLVEAMPTDTVWEDVPVGTVDKSHGSERPVTILCTTVQGNANADGMGFLSAEKRRFNVGLSRAQAGRIVIANKHTVGMTAAGKSYTAGPWNGFWAEGMKSVVNGTYFNRQLPDPLRARFNDVAAKFGAPSSTGRAIPGWLPEHQQSSTQKVDKGLAVLRFRQATGCSSDEEATKCLADVQVHGDLALAVHKWFTDNTVNEPAEEI